MKKLLIFILQIMFIVNISYSFPVISNLTISPSNNIFVGEDLKISFNCYDLNYSIQAAYIQISSSKIIFPKIYFDYSSGKYQKTIPGNYFDNYDTFSATIYCLNENNEANTTFFTFQVSKADSTLTTEKDKYYTNEQIVLKFRTFLNDAPIFIDSLPEVFINGNKIQPSQIPIYNVDEGWIIKIPPISNAGKYNIKVSIPYSRIKIENSIDLNIDDYFKIEVFNLDKYLVDPSSNITIFLKALEKGNFVDLSKENLNVMVSGIQAEIINVLRQGDTNLINVKLPDLESGTKELSLSISYKNYSKTLTKTINYLLPIRLSLESGTNFILESQSYNFRFIANQENKIEGKIVPGLYNVKIVSNFYSIILENALINTQEIPIKIARVENFNLKGFNVAGSYLIETSISFNNATLELKYDENKVFDESKIKVFRCEDFDLNKNYCYGSFEEVKNFVLDKNSNIVRIFTNKFSLYVIGTEKSLKLEMNFDKEKYFLNDVVKFTGYVVDEWNNRISNASIEIEVANTNIKIKLNTNQDGIFSGNFITPLQEGKYKVLVKVDADFSKLERDYYINVERSKEVSAIFPDSIKIESGKSLNVTLKIKNIGQSNLSNLKIEILNLPKEYFEIEKDFIDSLNINEEKNVLIKFKIPIGTNESTTLSEIKIYSEGIDYSKSFGFTILKSTESNSEMKSTGFFVLPKLNFNFDKRDLIILAVLIIIVVFTIISSKIKKKEKGRRYSTEEIKSEMDRILGRGG